LHGAFLLQSIKMYLILRFLSLYGIDHNEPPSIGNTEPVKKAAFSEQRNLIIF